MLQSSGYFSERYGFECLENMEFIHQNAFGFMPSGGRQTYSLDNLNLLAEHLPNPVLGMKHEEKLLAGYPETVPRESLSHGPGCEHSTQLSGAHTPTLKIKRYLHLGVLRSCLLPWGTYTFMDLSPVVLLLRSLIQDKGFEYLELLVMHVDRNFFSPLW